jgi:hypothetical protein
MDCEFQVGDIVVRKKEYQNTFSWKWGNKPVEIRYIPHYYGGGNYRLLFVNTFGGYDSNRFDLVESINSKDSLSDFL